MASRLTVIFYIVLCLEAGIVLTVAPWLPGLFGMGDWSNNYLLLLASQKTGLQGLQMAVASGWVRGAVTGLGLLNLSMAFWEIGHFRQTTRRLQGEADTSMRAFVATTNVTPSTLAATTPQKQFISTRAAADDDAAHTANADHLSHHERRDDAGHDSHE